MRETWSPPPVEKEKHVPTVWEMPKDMHDALAKVRELGGRLRLAAEDPAVREGSAASLRSAINCAVSIADFFPVFGAVASLGADAAKIWAHAEYAKRCKDALAEGKNPLDVKMSAVNLTPDVHLFFALAPEVIDICAADMLPSHAVGTAMQLRYDVPRMYAGFTKLREHLAGALRDGEDPQVIEATEAFNVKISK